MPGEPCGSVGGQPGVTKRVKLPSPGGRNAQPSVVTGPMTTGLTCVVADDHPAVLDAVSRYLGQHGVEVVGQASDGSAALAAIEELHPHVALIDLGMPGLDGFEVMRRATSSSPKTAVVVYTGHAEAVTVDEALDAGARGLVLKAGPLPDLLQAIESVTTGGVYVDPVLAAGFALRHTKSAPELSKREREILRMLSHGMTNEEIGREIQISPETVRTHVRRALTKLGSKTRTEAVSTALRRGLIS